MALNANLITGEKTHCAANRSARHACESYGTL
jgi:hypothetical protein